MRGATMKRIVWVLVILIALAALLGPGLIGKAAEKIIEKELNHAVQKSEAVELLAQEYQRGWFSSSIKTTLALHGEEYLSTARDLTGDDDVEQPVMIIDGSVRHGPFPASFIPALATSRVKVTLQAGDDHVFELPGEVHARLGFAGGGTARYLAEEMHETFEDGSLDAQWEGADVRVDFNADLSKLQTSGEFGAFAVEAESGTFTGGPATFVANRTRTEHGVWLGKGELQLDRITVSAPRENLDYSVSDLSLQTGASLAQDKVDYLMDIEAGSIQGGEFGEASALLRMTLSDLDASALGKLMEASQAGSDYMAAQMPNLMGDVQALLAGGPALDVSELRINTAEGETLISLNLELPESESAEQVPLSPELLTQLVGKVSLRVPKAILERLEALDPELAQNLQTLVAGGFLRSEGTLYVMDAAYEGGMLTVNGVPIPMEEFGSAPR